MDVSLGRFVVRMPEEWPVAHPGLVGRDDVLMFDVRPETVHTGRERIHPTVGLRHFTESEGGNVASAALREAFLGGRVDVDGFVLLSYEALFTQRGWPARRHHVLAWCGDLLWHSLRWYVGCGPDVLELTLTVETEADAAVLGDVCDRLARSVRVTASEHLSQQSMFWPEVPVDLRASGIADVITEQGLNPPWVESLQAGHDSAENTFAVGGWDQDPTAEQRRVLEASAPVLSSVGEKDGEPYRMEVCLDGEGGAVVVVVPDAGGTSRGVKTVPAEIAVPLLLAWTGLRADWLRDVVLEAAADEPLSASGGRWRVVGRTGPAPDVERRDWWRWWNADGYIVAEWMQPVGGPPFMVLRDERAAVGLPVVPGVFYSALQDFVMKGDRSSV